VEVRFREVLELAESEGITAYDASYLWLARLLNLELVTLDGGLATAAARRPDAPSPAGSP
jgi:predicted nucleic acid-binding protein